MTAGDKRPKHGTQESLVTARTSDSTSERDEYQTTLGKWRRRFIVHFCRRRRLAFRRRGGWKVLPLDSSTRPAGIRPASSIVIAVPARMVKGALRDAASLRFSLGLRPPLDHPGAIRGVPVQHESWSRGRARSNTISLYSEQMAPATLGRFLAETAGKCSDSRRDPIATVRLRRREPRLGPANVGPFPRSSASRWRHHAKM
jgi:hypothetical protein